MSTSDNEPTPAEAAYLEGYLNGCKDGYDRAVAEVMSEFVFPFDEEGDLDEEIVPIEDLLAIERIRHDYARNHPYFSIKGEQLA